MELPRFAAAAAAAGAAAAAWWLSKPAHRRRVVRRVRYVRGQMRGWIYHAAGHHPVEAVSDDVLAQRVRSVLGQTTKTLDLPRVHVAVSRRIVLLHGHVSAHAEADTLEWTARHVDGVDGVLSYLHVGLPAGATRPSEGEQAYAPSPALRQLLQAAESTGVPDAVASAAVRAVVATFFERLPSDARAHLLAHLPRDVQVLTTPPRLHGNVRRLRRFDDSIEVVLTAERVTPSNADEVARAVLASLRSLVPEEAEHVAAVLPHDLRRLWPSPASV